MFTFDGPNRIINIDIGTDQFDVEDMYSRWKDWTIISDNSKFLQAFSVIGGEPISPTNNSPVFFFILNGWKIKPHVGDHTLNVVGNLFVDGGIGSPFIPSDSGSTQIVTNTTTSPIASTGSVAGTVIAHHQVVQFELHEGMVEIPAQTVISMSGDLFTFDDVDLNSQIVFSKVEAGYSFTHTFNTFGWFKIRVDDGEGGSSWIHVQVLESTKHMLTEIGNNIQFLHDNNLIP